MSGFVSGYTGSDGSTFRDMKKVSRLMGIVVLGVLCALVTAIDKVLAKRQYARAALLVLLAIWLAWSCLRPA